MNLPSLPLIPTDSLHRFCAITGLLLMLVPPTYLDLRSEKFAKEVIHLEAERKIIALTMKETVVQKDELIMQMYQPGLSKRDFRILNHSRYLDSIVGAGLPIKMRRDSAGTIAKRISAAALAQGIALIRLEENGKSLLVSMDLTKRYLFLACLFGAIGGVMTVYGFKTWYRKENTEAESSTAAAATSA